MDADWGTRTKTTTGKETIWSRRLTLKERRRRGRRRQQVQLPAKCINNSGVVSSIPTLLLQLSTDKQIALGSTL